MKAWLVAHTVIKQPFIRYSIMSCQDHPHSTALLNMLSRIFEVIVISAILVVQDLEQIDPRNKLVLQRNRYSIIMVQTSEAIRGGGGSVKVGTTGKISALISRELESTKSSPNVPWLHTSLPVTIVDTTPKASSSSSFKNRKGLENIRRTKHYTGSTHHIPMLTSDDTSVDGTPTRRQKPIKRIPSLVEIVDIKCGDSVNPITHRLRKLGFSKLSESII